jgi:hypothetical protein
MLRRLISWFKGDPAPKQRRTAQLRRRSSAYAAVQDAAESSDPRELAPDFFDTNQPVERQVESAGPGKNILIRNKYIREDTGTHETLKILDDSALDSSDEDGIDPYNSGEFDRSKNWDKRFRS